MNDRVSTTREALLAELLGDVRVALDRMDELHADLNAVDASARQTATALTQATGEYRAQVDDLVAKLRVEMASVILKTTEHAAKTLVSQQTQTLQQAANQAFKQALTVELIRRTRMDWFKLIGMGAVVGAVAATAVPLLVRTIWT